MTLRCPHCGSTATHQQRDILGGWVICRSCSRHFAWRRANDTDMVVAHGRANPPGTPEKEGQHDG